MKTYRTEDVPSDRLTRLCNAMTETLDANPERGEEKCIIFLQEGNRGGLVLHGYEDDHEALVDLFIHMRAIFHANGQDLQIIGIK